LPLQGEDVGVVNDATIMATATALSPNTPPQPLKARLNARISDAS